LTGILAAIVNVAREGTEDSSFRMGGRDMTGQTSFTTAQRTMLVFVIGLVLSLGMTVPAAQAQLSMQISIEEATFEQGAFLVSGVVTCSEPTRDIQINVQVRQPTGLKKSQFGIGSDSPSCPGPEGLLFSVLAAPFSGRFKDGGLVFVVADVFGCSDFGCDSDSDSQVFTVSK
jgi:hypothetical protein